MTIILLTVLTMLLAGLLGVACFFFAGSEYNKKHYLTGDFWMVLSFVVPISTAVALRLTS